MIHHIFKIIWAERKMNVWILLEFILVFSVSWFCADYLFFMAKTYLQPKGFSTENVYKIDFKTKANIANQSTDADMQSNLWTIYDRVKQHPAIEQASFSIFAAPYSGYTTDNYMVDSAVQVAFEKTVMPEYFEVFGIGLLAGRTFNEADLAINSCIISGDANNLFSQQAVESITEINLKDTKYNVIGVANRFKQSEYEQYNCVIYKLLKKGDDYLPYMGQLHVKVKPGADKDFARQFKKDMKDQLNIGNYYLTSVTPVAAIQDNYMIRKGFDDDLKSVYSVTAFLLINIILIIVATFWFRVQSRRNEIGLRMALGSTHRNIKMMIVGEAVLLLFLAGIVSTIININITLVDVLKDIGIPTVDREGVPATIGQYFRNYIITFSFLAVVAVISVWYPAHKAGKLTPTEALKHEE